MANQFTERMKKREEAEKAFGVYKEERILSVDVARAAYCAGLFDGEGSVNAYITHPKNKNGTINNCGVLRICLGMTDLRIPKMLHRMFGGHLTSPKIRRAGWLPIQYWQITNDKALEVLRLFYPYLIVKKRQAALAFKFRNVIDQHLRNSDGHRLERLQNLVDEIKSLNRPPRPRAETVKGEPLFEVKSQSTTKDEDELVLGDSRKQESDDMRWVSAC